MPREGFPKIFEFMKRNWPGAGHIYVIKGNHGFFNGAEPKIIKLTFLDKKSTNMYVF